MTVAEVVKNARHNMKLSLDKAAKICGVSYGFLQHLETGETPRRVRGNLALGDKDSRYRKVAEALSLDADAFIAQVKKEQMTEHMEDEGLYIMLLPFLEEYGARLTDPSQELFLRRFMRRLLIKAPFDRELLTSLRSTLSKNAQSYEDPTLETPRNEEFSQRAYLRWLSGEVERQSFLDFRTKAEIADILLLVAATRSRSLSWREILEAWEAT